MALVTDPDITAIQDTSGTPSYTSLTLSGSASVPTTLSVTSSPTIASSASAVWNGISVPTSTATLSGVTNVTTATGFNLFSIAAPALVGTVTVTNSATMYIGGAPSISGGGAITNAYSLWVDAGISRFDGPIYQADGSAAAPSYAFALEASGMYLSGTGSVDISIVGTRVHAFQSTAYFLLSDSASIRLGAGFDVQLHRDAAAVLALKNGTTAQTLRVYGTTTGPAYAALLHTGTAGQALSNLGAMYVTSANGSNVNLGMVGTEVLWQVNGTTGGLVSGGNFRFSHGTSALATTATEGFAHWQSCAGAPTGVPATIPTGQVPMVFDTTNARLYFYHGAAWHYVAQTA